MTERKRPGYKSRVDIDDAIKMRKEGATLAEIGEKYNVSRQRVIQLIGKGHRKDGEVFKHIPYLGLRLYIEANRAITVPTLARIVFGYSNGATQQKVRNLLMGKETMLSIKQIKSLMKETGMPFETLFRKDK